MARRASGAHFKADDDRRPGRAGATAPRRLAATAPGRPVGISSHRPGEPAPGPRRSRARVVSNVLLAVGVVLLLAAAGMWGLAQWRYHEQDVMNERLAQFAQVSDDPNQAPVVDWEGLKAINPDVVGWIQVPGTVINYPVYQGDDNDYYLNTNAEGAYGVGGQIFLDYENKAPGMQDQQTMVYGHHLKNGSMFKQIADMDNQELFDSVDTVWYVTEDATYELQPLLVYYTTPDDTAARTINFASTDEFRAYLSDLLSRSVTSDADAETIIGGTTHVMTLSTCNYIDGYGRTLLVCVEKGEAAAALSEGAAS